MQQLFIESGNLLNNKKIHMISYGNEKFKNSKKRIFNEGINSKFFYSIEVLGPENLDIEFKSKFNRCSTNFDVFGLLKDVYTRRCFKKTHRF